MYNRDTVDGIVCTRLDKIQVITNRDNVWLILFSLHRVFTADMPFLYGITNSSDTIPTEHLTDTTGMVKQIYGKDYEPDTDYLHPSERPKPKVVEKPKEDDTPKPVMDKLKAKAQKPKADEDEEHLEL